MEDIVIRGGMIADGTGKPAWKGDVAVREGRITAAGEDLSGLQARKILDAEGCIVAPGFIDSHAHSDTTFLLDGSSACKLYQGITTEVSGQCGGSPFPALEKYCRIDDHEWICSSFDEFVKRFEQGGYSMAVNQAMLTGHGSLRAGVIGYEDRPVTRDEMETMKRLLRADLEAGAWGMSLGLEYAPGFFADTDELSELASVVREYDGLVPCHMRSEGLHIDEAIDELAEIGRRSGARVHVSHLKIDDFSFHGNAQRVWAVIEQARSEGVSVTADVYPFTASCTSLTIRCPKWSLDGGTEALLRHLTGERREEVIQGIRRHYFNADRAETCLFSDDGGLWPQIVGRTLRDVAENDLHTTDYASAAAEVILRTRGRTNCIFFVMDERDMRYFLSRGVFIGSDGWAMSGDPEKVQGKPHPRSYGAVTEFLRIARETGMCSLEEAVHRITGAPAGRLGLWDRGEIAVGKKADITVFDKNTIAPAATYLDSVRLSKGVKHVLVEGTLALFNGVQTDARSGRYLRKNHQGSGPFG
jgi:N-acyl-D-amino-acid deacylase